MKWLWRRLQCLFDRHICDASEAVDTRKPDGSGYVEYPCLRCGAKLRGPYGLALGCRWGRRTRP